MRANARAERRLRVLFVDDEASILDLLSRALMSACDVMIALDEESAWPHIEAGVDVLVCDLRLRGEKSGLSIIRRAATVQRIPRVIAMSAVATPSDAFALANAGALFFLQKPFGVAELWQAIATVVDEPPALKPFVAAQLGTRKLADVEDDVRKTLVEQALAQSEGNRSAAASMLGLTRQRVSQILKGK